MLYFISNFNKKWRQKNILQIKKISKKKEQKKIDDSTIKNHTNIAALYNFVSKKNFFLPSSSCGTPLNTEHHGTKIKISSKKKKNVYYPEISP